MSDPIQPDGRLAGRNYEATQRKSRRRSSRRRKRR